MTGGKGVPSGWYPDPERADALRWWDGSRWTDHVASARFPIRGQFYTPPAKDPSVSSDAMVWAIPVRRDDGGAIRLLVPSRRAFRASDDVAWVRQGWLPVAALRYGYTYIDRQGREVAAETGRAIELATGSVVSIPRAWRQMRLVPESWATLRPRWSPEEIGFQVRDGWERVCAEPEPSEIAQLKARLATYGVPSVAESLSVAVDGYFLFPFYAALNDTFDGGEIRVVEGVAGTLDDNLSLTFTDNASDLLDELRSGRALRGAPDQKTGA